MAPDAASTDPASPETPPPSGAWSIDAVQLEPGSEATNDPAVLLLPWALGRAGWLLGLTALMVPALALLAAGLPSAEGWQRFSALVLAQGPLALLGLVLAHLAVLLDPEDRQLRRRLTRLRRAAAVGALVLVLLIPLQLWLMRAVPDAVAGRPQLEQRLEQRFAALRQAVVEARSLPELRERLRLLQGPPLSPQADVLPLPVLRQRLLRALDRSQPFVRERLADNLGQQAQVRDGLEALRLVVPSLLYAIALASLSPLAPLTLPDRWFRGARGTALPIPSRRGRDAADQLAQELAAQAPPEASAPTPPGPPPPPAD
jgi:hypothetical protein